LRLWPGAPFRGLARCQSPLLVGFATIHILPGILPSASHPEYR
jgi:hypothetical protein